MSQKTDAPLESYEVNNATIAVCQKKSTAKSIPKLLKRLRVLRQHEASANCR